MPDTVDSTPNGGFAERVLALPPNQLVLLSDRVALHTTQFDPASRAIIAFLHDLPTGDFLEFNRKGQVLGCELIDPAATAGLLAAAGAPGFKVRLAALISAYWR